LPELRFAQTVRLRILEERPMRKPNLVAVAFASITTAVVAGAIGVVVTPTEAFLRAAKEQLYLPQNYREGQP